jgi:hypothetical protein
LKTFLTPSESGRRRVFGWGTVAAVLAVSLLGCASFKHLTQVSDTFPHAKECGKCHVDIYREWSESDHAGAYASPHFRAATDDYAFESCLNCHAPEPMLTRETPPVRAAGRIEGVTCVACHLDEGELCGPLKPTGKVHPHPIGVRPDVYHDTAICGRCHEGTIEQWNSATGEKDTCQQCHMEPVTRKVTQATGGISNFLVSMEKKVLQRRHVCGILNDSQPPGLIGLTATRSGSALNVRVDNHLPHNLPTGDFGFRLVTLEVFSIDADGHATPVRTWELAKELGTAIPPQASQTWSLDLADDVKAIRAVLTRRSYDQSALVLAQSETQGVDR